jgi:type 1 glutamine amidotransferase
MTHVHVVAAGKYHDIDFARLELLKLLAEKPAIRTSVAADYASTGHLANADFLITYTCDLAPGADEVAALAAFLERGGRWLALHGTNSLLRFLENGTVATPDDAPGFMELLGTRFAAHPPIGAYKVHITRDDHVMTRGLRAFNTIDELYLVRPTAPIDVLMHTSFTGSCPEFVDREWDEAQVPVLYERRLWRGSVLYLTLGHCRGHYDLAPIRPFNPHPERGSWNYPIFYELLRRAIAWGARDEEAGHSA